MPKTFPIFFFVVMALAACQSAEAQVQVPATSGRPLRGIFGGGPPPAPNRSRKELTTTADMLIGHDDNLRQGGDASSVGLASSQEPGYRGVGSAGLRYFSGREGRSLTTTGRGYVTRYSTVQKPGIGGDFQFDGTTNLGRKTRLGAGGTASYEPFFRIGAFGALGDGTDREQSPDANPLNGIDGQHSMHSSGSMTFGRRWARRDSTDVKYSYSKSDYQDPSGFDGNLQELTVSYTRAVGSLNIKPSYRRSEQHLLESGQADHRITFQSVELGGIYQGRPSRNRRLSLTAGVEATRTLEFGAIGAGRLQGEWTPAGHGGVDFGVGRTWAFGVDYRRAVVILDAISRRPIATDAALLRLGGFAGRRLELILSSGYSAGRQTSAAGLGRFDNRSLSGEARYTVARSMYMRASYTHFEQRMSGFNDRQAGIPARFARNVVNIGVSMWLPLYGTWGSTQRPVSGRS